MACQQMAKTMKPEKVLEYLVQENDIHYQHYYGMRKLLLSYKLPVSMLKTTDEPKAFFDKVYLTYRDSPSTVGRRIIEDTSELIEQVIKNNQEIQGFNARMSKEVVGFVNIYNDWIMDKLCKDKSDSPACWNNMKETMKRLVQEEEEWEAERHNLQGELFKLFSEKCKTEERELSALRTKVKLQKDLRCANKIISTLEKIHSCCEGKLKKRKEKSLTKKFLEFFCKKFLRNKQSWENNREMKATRNMAQGVENSDDDSGKSDEDVENSDDDTENSDEDVENSDDDTENSYEDMENSDDDTGNSDEDLENIFKLMENSKDDTENSDEDVENSDDDTANSDEDLENIFKLMEKSKYETENSAEDVENSAEDVENSAEDVENSEDMAEVSFLQNQKSDADHWSKEVKKQLEEASDVKRSYKQCIDVLIKEAKAIKKHPRPEKAP